MTHSKVVGKKMSASIKTKRDSVTKKRTAKRKSPLAKNDSTTRKALHAEKDKIPATNSKCKNKLSVKSKSVSAVKDKNAVINASGKRKPRSDRKLLKRNLNKRRVTDAVQYLHKWKCNRSEWVFHKKCQATLLRRCFDKVVSQDDFTLFIEYARSIKGGAVHWLKALCESKLKVEPGNDSFLKTAQERAGILLKVLSGEHN